MMKIDAEDTCANCGHDIVMNFSGIPMRGWMHKGGQVECKEPNCLCALPEPWYAHTETRLSSSDKTLLKSFDADDRD